MFRYPYAELWCSSLVDEFGRLLNNRSSPREPHSVTAIAWIGGSFEDPVDESRGIFRRPFCQSRQASVRLQRVFDPLSVPFRFPLLSLFRVLRVLCRPPISAALAAPIGRPELYHSVNNLAIPVQLFHVSMAAFNRSHLVASALGAGIRCFLLGTIKRGEQFVESHGRTTELDYVFAHSNGPTIPVGTHPIRWSLGPCPIRAKPAQRQPVVGVCSKPVVTRWLIRRRPLQGAAADRGFGPRGDVGGQ